VLSKDFHHAVRSLRKCPGFTVIVVITLALGIGTSVAIFGVTNAVLLRPLPYEDPARLAVACYDMRKRNVRDFPFSNANFLDLRKGASAAFEDIAAVRTGRVVVPALDGTPEQVRVGIVSTNFFRLMGARIVLGRDFTDQDGLVATQPPVSPGAPTAPTAPQMVILSYQYWQRHYGGDRRVLAGWKNPTGTRVVGVLEPGFELLFPADANLEQKPDFWNSARIPYDPANRNNVQWRLIGRLRARVRLDQAQREAERVAAEVRRIDSISNTADAHIRIVPMKEHLIGGVKSTVMALMGAVVLLVLIGSANVANLLLVRTSLRERELAVRAAIGGSAWDLARQAMAEALLLAGGGAALGVALAWAGIRQLLTIAPPAVPRLSEVQMDPAVLAFAVAVGLVCAVLFGLAPVIRATRPDLIQLLSGSRGSAGLNRGGLLRSGVAVAEVALSFVLLIASGLMIRTFVALSHVQPGYDAHNLLTFQSLGGRPLREPPARAAFQHQIQTRLASIPGVESVAASFPLPLTGNFNPTRWGPLDALTDQSKFQAADFQFVLPGYFKTMRTPILEGREFAEADNQPGRKLIIIDQNLAAKAFPGRSAVGQRILARITTPAAESFEVIGVAAHVRNTDLAVLGREQIYFSDAYQGNFANRWALRTQGDPANYAAAVREQIRRQDASLLITELQPMEEWVERSMASTRLSVILIGMFASIAGVLAAVGLYGVLSTVVRQRTAEIGVRIALGAAPGRIFSLVVGYGLRLSAAGIAIGLLLAFTSTRVMETMLVGVKPADPATFVTITVIFLLIAGAAAWVPARRAVRLDPTMALREE
jgi:predicted permease